MKHLLSAFSVMAAIISVNFMVVPAFWIRLYGGTPDTQAVFLYRLIAAVFGGLAVIAWCGRSAAGSGHRDSIVRGSIVLNALATLVAVSGAVTGVYNRFAWGPVLMFAAFTAAFAWSARPQTPATE